MEYESKEWEFIRKHITYELYMNDNEYLRIAVILSSIWKNDSAFTYVDNMNSIVMLSLNPEVGKKTANIITGLMVW